VRIRRPRAATSIQMVDAIDAGNLPPVIEAAAGYVDGHWPSYRSIRARYPRALVLSIAVNHTTPAMVLDVEQGDATPAGAAEWLHVSRQSGFARPCIYTSLSRVAELAGVLERAGHPRASYRLWTAHYTGLSHICGRKCGYPLSVGPGATQWLPGSRSRGWDTSLTTREWVSGLINDFNGAQL
jgi:hypothetical protein